MLDHGCARRLSDVQAGARKRPAQPNKKTRMLDDKASKMRPNNRRWWRITIIGVHSLKPDQAHASRCS
jgi:hypothetical protein